MKFQKGSKVEVMNKTELPTSWCVAEVVSGNRHTYNLRYDCYPGVEKVSREFIRPCPPVSKDLQSWMAGDIVEVFDDNSWKTATVCKVADGGHFSVRPHGFTHERNVQISEIRARQSWQDGHWVPIVKISGSYGDMKDNCLVVYNDGGLQESRVLKRASPFCSSPGNSKNLKEHRRRKRRRLEKVDAFAYPDDKNTQASFYNPSNGFYEPEKENLNILDGCSLARISEPNHSDYDQCSVGSCSISSDGQQNKSTSPYAAILSSDAESFSTSRDDEGDGSPLPQEGWAESIHRLELHGYRSTLEALYASGPLSWEKEALLTNLRINLHISNDEHLTELRHLISAGAGILD